MCPSSNILYMYILYNNISRSLNYHVITFDYRSYGDSSQLGEQPDQLLQHFINRRISCRIDVHHFQKQALWSKWQDLKEKVVPNGSTWHPDHKKIGFLQLWTTFVPRLCHYKEFILVFVSSTLVYYLAPNETGVVADSKVNFQSPSLINKICSWEEASLRRTEIGRRELAS